MKPGKVLLFGLLGLVVAQVIAYFQQSANPLLSAALTVAAGAIPLVIDYVKEKGTQPEPAGNAGPPRPSPQSSPYPPHYPYPYQPAYPPTPARRARPRFGALLAALLVLALVGGGIAYGATYVVGRVTGNEPSVQRLTQPVAGKAGALSMRIEEVGVGDHYTHVRLTATNRADFPVNIPLFDNCQLVEPGRPALEAKTDFTTSEIDVPAGSVPVTSDVVFTGIPSDGATSLTLACTTLYWQGFGQPQSLQVKGIALRAA